MFQNNRNRSCNRCFVVTGILVMFGFAGHSAAVDTPPAPALAGEDQTPPRTNRALAEPEGIRLVSREEMLKGMIEAEKLRSAEARPDAAIDNTAMLEKWGVQVIGVSYAADGFWLEFRFRVADPEKAGTLFDSKIKPYLESEASGVKMAVPTAAKVGALRTTDRGRNIKANKIYNIMFANPAFHVKPGQKVRVVAGDFKAEHMTVRGARQNLSIGLDPAVLQETQGMSEPMPDRHGHHHQMLERQGYERSIHDYAAPDLALVDMNGKTTTLREALDTWEPVMMNFIFTTCTTICPVLTATFSQIQEVLGDEAEQVRMISITIDPEQDTPQRLKAFAERYGAGSQWRFLTGELDNIVAVQKAFDIYRGNKTNHEPITLLRGAGATSWLRIEGIASASEIIGEYHSLISAGK